MTGRNEPAGVSGVPPRQHNFETAVVRALEALAGQSEEQLAWLGAAREGKRWTVPVLDDVLSVDFSDGSVRTSTGEDVSRFWRVIVLHYLAVSVQPEAMVPSISFAELPIGRTYAPVYQGRVISRLCHTAGRDEATLLEAAGRLGGEAVALGDLGFDFSLFPRVTLRMIWYAGDDELRPSASMLLPSNIETFFNVEDIVVLSEGLVARLGGRPF